MSGILFIVGMGPGCDKLETVWAHDVLSSCEIIAGYTVYVELLKDRYPGKEYITTPMRAEIERCRICLARAQEGKSVALVCSGDAGVYGMASPVYELCDDYSDVDICVVPGITAANSGAAVLGAPLNHDYCVISLSDLLTPWEVIEKRIRAAIEGDFAMAIYNPSSHKRADYLRKACDIMADAGADKNRACGYVRNIGRDGQESHVCTLSELRDETVDMFTTVFVGNKDTYIKGNKLITKRGYKA